MKSQVAAEVAAASALARSGWRPARGELLIVTVVDEETGGALGAQWITENHPEKVRCDLLVNEGGGAVFEYGGRRCYGVCCAEKGVFRFTVTTDGVAGHASMPSMGDQRAAEDGPAARPLRRAPALLQRHRGGARLPRAGSARTPPTRRAALARLRAEDPRLAIVLRAADGRDLHAHEDPRLGEDQRDPQPRRAAGRLPRPAGPRRAARSCEGIEEVLGPAGRRLRDRVHRAGRRQPLGGRLAADGRHLGWVAEHDPGAQVVPGRAARASPTRATSGSPSRSAWPTASSPSATSRCSSPRR